MVNIHLVVHSLLFGASLVAQRVKHHLQYGRPGFNSWVGEIPWRSHRLPTLVFLGFCCGSAGKKSSGNVGDLGLIPGLERSPGEGDGNSTPVFLPEKSR